MRRREMDKLFISSILSLQLLFPLFPSGVGGLGAPIHLRSPRSAVFREGQNPENRLHGRHFVTAHPSPAAQHQRAARNWDTNPPKIHRGGAARLCFCACTNKPKNTRHFVPARVCNMKYYYIKYFYLYLSVHAVVFVIHRL